MTSILVLLWTTLIVVLALIVVPISIRWRRD
jgi:hypothetical protein